MLAKSDKFPLNLWSEIEKSPLDYRLLERVPFTAFDEDVKFPIMLHEPVGDEVAIVILDSETTGLNPGEDLMIELAMVRAMYSPSLGNITSINAVFDEFEDPHIEIPPKVEELTGITMDMVKGKSFDMDAINRLLADDPLIIAHNAGFDRKFFDARFDGCNFLLNLRWTCTVKTLQWGNLDKRLCFSKKLGNMLFNIGYFFEAHRANADCLALLWLLHKVPRAFTNLMDNTFNRTTLRVIARNMPIEYKDKVKASRYKWNNSIHAWTITCFNNEQVEEECKYLRDLYDPNGTMVLVENNTIDPRWRFKENAPE